MRILQDPHPARTALRLLAFAALVVLIVAGSIAPAFATVTPQVIGIRKQLSVPDSYRIDHGIRLDPVTGTLISNLTSASAVYPSMDGFPPYAFWDEYPQYTRDRKRVLFWRSSLAAWLPPDYLSDHVSPSSYVFFRNVTNTAPYEAGEVRTVPPFARAKYQVWHADPESPALAMSPNGRWIVYGENHPKGAVDYSWLIAIDLAHHDPYGNYYTRIISRTTKPGWRFSGMEFTPDGSKLFICESNKVNDGKMKLITFSTSSKLIYTWTMPALSADYAENGTRVVYETPSHQVWWCNAGNSSGKHQILTGNGYRPRFSNTVNHIIVSRGMSQEDAWRVTYNGTGFTTDLLAADVFQPDW